MSFKLAYTISFNIVYLLVAMTSLQTQVEAGPSWCFYNDYATTQSICKSLGGKWDGSSCGFVVEDSQKLLRST
ncbi:hypothetical protein BGZ96_005028 [Linnemannia gamsii]|uniref:Secreted protein n=1 Tax=Linnemannia gamsii TaxID=64522 RepID=A0ABQ7K5N1_9FUNG|nr:hypothetical protein BGZ96_005028 [Linnemannia gamsii]